MAVPEHVITQSETVELGRRLYAGHRHLELATRMIQNTGVLKRHIVRPLDETLNDVGFHRRNQVFEQEAKKRVPAVVAEALKSANLDAGDIDAILFLSCTGFMLPSLTAWLINEMGFKLDTTQLPIAQLGCAAGAAAINRANDFCLSHPGCNALIIACEFCSLTYQPDDRGVGSLLSAGLFGDAIAAAVVRGDEKSAGLRLGASYSFVVPGTTSWISYEVRETGFHFRLNKGVPGVLKTAMPALTEFVRGRGHDLRGLDFYAIHTGGPRVLGAVHDPGGVPQEALAPSLETLQNYGNTASVSVFDVLRRIADTRPPETGDNGLIVGFGPGITMEAILGTWTAGILPALRSQSAQREVTEVGVR